MRDQMQYALNIHVYMCVSINHRR